MPADRTEGGRCGRVDDARNFSWSESGIGGSRAKDICVAVDARRKKEVVGAERKTRGGGERKVDGGGHAGDGPFRVVARNDGVELLRGASVGGDERTSCRLDTYGVFVSFVVDGLPFCYVIADF